MIELPAAQATWSELRDHLVDDDPKRKDYTMTVGDLTVRPLDTHARVNIQGSLVGRFVEGDPLVGLDLTPRAYGQYLQKLGIPYGFATTFSGDLQGRMIAERLPDLDPTSDIFLRTRPEGVRAILSGRYGNMRDLEVANVLNDLHGDLSGYRVLRGKTLDHVFAVTLIGETPVHSNGDSYFPIIQIRNSEVGASAFVIVDGICKGACSNGMLFGFREDSRTRMRHLGSTMHTRVVEAMNKALKAPARWSEQVAPAIERAQSVEINTADEKQVEKLVRNLRNHGLTKKFANEVVETAKSMPVDIYGEEFAHGDVITQWSVINAMTHLVQSDEWDEVDRNDVEELAGRLLLRAA